MNEALRERLARISGLRPVRTTPGGRSTDAGALPARAGRLLPLLGAVTCANASGEHLAVSHRFTDCRAPARAQAALDLLAPGSRAEAADCRRWLFLDTETTGLAGGTGTYAFLVGLAWWGPGGLEVEQLFMRDHREERSLLEQLSARVAERPVLITFNGKSFDWPLLEARYRVARALPGAQPEAHVDLLHAARQVWQPRLGSVRLSQLERRVLGVERGYDLPSELIPGCYFSYLRGGPAEPLADVFRHNRLDLAGLARLAAHLVELLENLDRAPGDALELYGLSRLVERRGSAAAARGLYERALRAGLPEPLSRVARWELARLAKRDRDYARAATLWHELADSASASLPACEQLAIYYEHRARDPVRAAACAEDARAALERAGRSGSIEASIVRQLEARLAHRLARLRRKCSVGAPVPPP